jgi:hypothetical protein
VKVVITMDAPSMQVKCGVESCHYNKQNMCFAHGLEVNPKGGTKAKTSDATCCTTFIPEAR